MAEYSPANNSSLSDSSPKIVYSSSQLKRKKPKIMTNMERFQTFCTLALTTKRKLTTQELKDLKNHRQKLEEILREYDTESQDKENQISELHQRIFELKNEIKSLKPQAERREQSDKNKPQNENEEEQVCKAKEIQKETSIEQGESDAGKNIEDTPKQRQSNGGKIPVYQSTPTMMIKQKTRSEWSQTPRRMPVQKELTKFQEKLAKNMDIEELMDLFITINYRKKADGKAEAEKYEAVIKEKIDEIIAENINLKRNINTIQKTMQDNYTVLEQANIERQQKIDALMEEIAYLKTANETNVNIPDSGILKSINDIAEREKKGLEVIERETERINELEETKQKHEKQLRENEDKIHELKEAIQKYETKLRENEEKIREMTEQMTKREEIVKMVIEKDANGIINSHIKIMEKLQKIEDEIKGTERQSEQKINKQTDDQLEEQYDKQHKLYSTKVKTVIEEQQFGQKVQKRYSKSAVLIQRTTTKLSLNDIRTILTREARGKTMIKDILCRPARDGNTLIIKGQTEEETQELLKIIETVQTLKDSITITIKTTNIKKIIILGIPIDINHEDILKDLQKQYKPETPIEILKEPRKRTDAKTYSIILEAEDWVAMDLLKRQNIKIHFNTCRIQLYLPVIRCTRCQQYGHVEDKCRGKETCQYCAGRHAKSKEKYCMNMKKYKNPRCINCIGTQGDFPHEAGSRDCPAFHFQIQQRNIYAKSIMQNSIW